MFIFASTIKNNKMINIEKLEVRLLKLKDDGKYNEDYLRIFGSYRIWLMSDETLTKIDNYLTNKSY